MPNGSAHYDKAEGLLDHLDELHYYELDDRSEYMLRVAAVHAQLATAGALAALIAETKRANDAIHPASPHPTPLELRNQSEMRDSIRGRLGT